MSTWYFFDEEKDYIFSTVMIHINLGKLESSSCHVALHGQIVQQYYVFRSLIELTNICYF